VSEPGHESPTSVPQSRHLSTSEIHERSFTTRQANLRSSQPERTTQSRDGMHTRSREQRPSQEVPTVESYGSRHRTSFSEHSYDPGSHSDDADSSSDSEQNALVHEIQRLQERLASLQHSDANPDDAGVPAKSWKTLHEVQCINSGRLTCYLDEPELCNDQELGHLHWQGTRHVTNVEAWIRKQKQPFTVYRRYYCVHDRKEMSEPIEKVHILSEELDNALLSWLEASPGLAIYGDEDVYADNELEAPYLCFYHFRHEARQLLSESEDLSGSPSRDRLQLLQYLETSTAAITQEAEEMFASGKVTAKLMPYLFKPGALVCFEDSGESLVCEQTSLLDLSFEDRDLQRRSYELSTARIAFDGKFRRLRPFTHRVDFRAARNEPLNIADLAVQPLSHIPSERRTELKRRGDTFMRCRKQLYVTYPTRGGHHDFVCHLALRLVRARIVETLTVTQVDTRFMVDVECFHMLHDKEASEESDREPPISQSSLESLEGTEEFLLQLPPTIEGFNMTEKKWSTYLHHYEERSSNAKSIQSTYRSVK
jgi:hypothetical protein